MNSRHYPLLILALGAFFYLPFLGRVHLFDWDEINFAESAREMLVTGNFARVQINFEPFWEKPPLFFWLQATAMSWLGVGEYAARLPNALIGIATLLTFYRVGTYLHGPRFGLLWAVGYLGALTPHLYFKTGIIDPTFNLFIFLGVWYTYLAAQRHDKPKAGQLAALAGLFVGLAILTKGPVGALLAGLTFGIVWALARFRPLLRFGHALLAVGIALGIASLWFGLEIIQNGPWFLQEFIEYQIRLFSTPDAGHGQPFYYHFVVVLVGCFPLSIFAIRYLTASTDPRDFRLWMVVLFWVVMILFSIVKTKIVHYSSMAWFPVSYLAARHIADLLAGRVAWNRWLTAGLLLIGGLLGLLLTALPVVGRFKAMLIPYINDPFAVANLQANVTWGGWEWIIGLAYLAVLLTAIIRLGHFVRARRNNVPENSLPGPIWALFGATAVCLWLYLALIVPKIEEYVQGAVVRFYTERQGQDVYAEPIGYKSYAQLFYFRKQPPVNPKTRQSDYLLNGPVDKPTYLITKITVADQYRANPNLRLIREENGYVLFERK
ncbi:glycosyl transferase family 39 [Fibrella aestuarina BUZ 2]|uniref:Glycosyl transferase family 39 n=1 Tax=Fibrella aestuarina BUZ 2 TaxID=1166018 RepID=I0K3I2_9BACT|nr:glycosyltransferase family 39 protein [Fibrella aestuarina]CCG98685.1 glycosyl transferase family 39 [Fibrella aestuarina BUZ 2]